MINGYDNGPYLHFYCGGGEKVAVEGKGNHGVEGKNGKGFSVKETP
jgi:hypothetical protein